MLTSCELKALAALPLFHDVNPTEIEGFALSMQRQVIPGGVDIFSLAQPASKLCLLFDGTVKIVMGRSNHDDLVIELCGPGDILGDIYVADGLPPDIRAVTSGRSIVLWIESSHCLRYLQTMPTLTFNTAIGALRRLRSATERTQMFSTLGVAGRIAYQLLFFAQRYGTAPDSIVNGGLPGQAQSTLIRLHFTQHDLAGLVGSTRPYVNAALATFQKLGWISRDADGFIRIHDTDALRKRCKA